MWIVEAVHISVLNVNKECVAYVYIRTQGATKLLYF